LFDARPPNNIKGKTIKGAIDCATISSSKLEDIKYPIEAAERQISNSTI
jgi:hypothetical protein